MKKDFVTVTPDSGSNDGSLSVVCDAGDAAASTIISVAGGGITKTINVSRKENDLISGEYNINLDQSLFRTDTADYKFNQQECTIEKNTDGDTDYIIGIVLNTIENIEFIQDQECSLIVMIDTSLKNIGFKMIMPPQAPYTSPAEFQGANPLLQMMTNAFIFKFNMTSAVKSLLESNNKITWELDYLSGGEKFTVYDSKGAGFTFKMKIIMLYP